MTARELIKAVSKCHPDTLVVVTGYEDGYDDPEVRPVTVWDRQGEDKATWYSGRYEQHDRWAPADANPIDALEVGR